LGISERDARTPKSDTTYLGLLYLPFSLLPAPLLPIFTPDFFNIIKA
jgi:hypothetical protein